MSRARVLKTYKLWLNGAFVRSESGRSYEARDARGDFWANAPLASRKDLRDAVQAACKAQPSWATRTAYNRGQILYRIAEMLETHRAALREELQAVLGVSAQDADAEIEVSVDRWVYYAGWSDKYAALLSSVNPVAMPMHNFTVPEPVGVVGIVCPDAAPLASLTSLLAPPLVSGNAIVALLPEAAPTVGLAFAEVLATSDLPAGVVNLLSGRLAELTPHLARHVEVDVLNLCGAPEPERVAHERTAAESITRLHHSPNLNRDEWLTDQAQGLGWIEPFVEFKTVWHPLGW
ncbi:MAG: aldehyde dehydrogenase family protein [Fimbriimonadales bacterium]